MIGLRFPWSEQLAVDFSACAWIWGAFPLVRGLETARCQMLRNEYCQPLLAVADVTPWQSTPGKWQSRPGKWQLTPPFWQLIGDEPLTATLPPPLKGGEWQWQQSEQDTLAPQKGPR